MLEIAPSSRPPLATIVAILLPLLALALLLLRRAVGPMRQRLLVGALGLGMLLTAASTAGWSRRHAGTGTETAHGWPQILHARWVPFDGGDARAGLQWRGLVINTLVYAAAAAVLLAVGHQVVRRRRATHTGGPSVST